MVQASESAEQVVALKQQIQQLQGKWRQEQQHGEELSRKLFTKLSQVTLPSRKIMLAFHFIRGCPGYQS